MGELEVARLSAFKHEVRVDEPYQHFQFAGRADVVAIDRARRALLHIENRTRFPNIGEAAGSFNQKREYLANRLAERIGIDGFRSETHAMIVLWSAEALHSVRIRLETFRALCPDPIDVFSAWWDGQDPPSGRHRTMVVFDPAADVGKHRRFIDIETARTADPRYRCYADAARRLGSP
ncbi:MAG TPA: hypothetical protein VIM30_12795 [Candidatus Limnocylindrales bacterium]|jgi:hypothetical protein